MKAIIWTEYGPPEVLQVGEVDKPHPKEDQILVRIQAAGVTAGDCEMRRLALPLGLGLPIRLYAGLLRPNRIKILGQELAGVVESIGTTVSNYQPGDEVYGSTGFGFGAYAEYICLPAEPGDAQGVLALRPRDLTPEQAAVVPTAGLEALHYLREGNASPGTKVLVVGGGGSIGSYAIQIAKHFGAQVTAVDRPEKLELMRSLGAEQVVDCTTEDISTIPARFNLVIDVVGRKGIAQRLKLLKPGGKYFLAYAQPRDLLLSLWISLTSTKRLRIESSSQRKSDLEYLTNLIESNQLKPQIDRTFPLEDAAGAHHYAESGKKLGNIALRVNMIK